MNCRQNLLGIIFCESNLCSKIIYCKGRGRLVMGTREFVIKRVWHVVGGERGNFPS